MSPRRALHFVASLTAPSDTSTAASSLKTGDHAAGSGGSFLESKKRGLAGFFPGSPRTPPGGGSGGVRIKRGSATSRLETRNNRGTANSMKVRFLLDFTSKDYLGTPDIPVPVNLLRLD